MCSPRRPPLRRLCSPRRHEVHTRRRGRDGAERRLRTSSAAYGTGGMTGPAPSSWPAPAREGKPVPSLVPPLSRVCSKRRARSAHSTRSGRVCSPRRASSGAGSTHAAPALRCRRHVPRRCDHLVPHRQGRGTGRLPEPRRGRRAGDRRGGGGPPRGRPPPAPPGRQLARPPVLPEPAETSNLTVVDVDTAATELAQISGPGSARDASAAVRSLFERATAEEQAWLRGLVTGETRQGAGDGVMLQAIAKASGVPDAAVRRAVMLAGHAGPVARAALDGGAEALDALTLEVGRPLRPMLGRLGTRCRRGPGHAGRRGRRRDQAGRHTTAGSRRQARAGTCASSPGRSTR